jgi:hypothetical protein
MRQTEPKLSEEDRSMIEAIRCKGGHQAREVHRAHVLSSLDRGVSESRIMAVLGMIDFLAFIKESVTGAYAKAR